MRKRKSGTAAPPGPPDTFARPGLETYMSPGHPLFHRTAALSQNEYDSRVVQTAAQLIQDVHDAGHAADPARAEQYLSDQVLPAHLASRFAQHGKAGGDKEIIPAVDGAILAATHANDNARDNLYSRNALPDKRIAVGTSLVSYAHNRQNLAANIFIAEGLQARGYANLLKTSKSAWATPIALGIAALETTVSSRLFNVSLTNFNFWSFLGFLGFTLIEIVVTVVVPSLLVGPARRRVRERLLAARLLNTASAAATAKASGTP